MAGAMAQDMDGDHDVRVDADHDYDIRPYAGVGVGLFGLEFKSSTSNLKKNVFGGYGKLGTDIGDYLGVELRIGGTASGTQNNTKLQASSLFSYLGKVQFPTTPDWKFYAMLGGTTVNFKVGNQSKSKSGFSFGVGAESYLQERLTLGAEWMQYWTDVKLGSAFGTNAKARLWGVTVTGAYRF
ncbi:MAG: porin family protein [Zetaproteobacteria bacterium]|nr:MAG: porin family protein [Zetaproteobacteria bacterium]